MKSKPATPKAAKQEPASGDKRVVPARSDYGAPVEGFFARQPPALRPIVEGLHALILKAAPDATASLKWGMPFYEVKGGMMCAIGAHKAHVNLILSGPPGTYADPEQRLEGEGKTGRHLKIRSVDELPRQEVIGWLRRAAELARTHKRS